MFSYLDGIVSFKKGDHFALEVGGIGFKIFCSISMLARIPAQGEKVRIYTYMAVREDNISLFGFPTPEELSLFEMLLTVSGIGPKVAGQIVGTLEPASFALAVIASDIATLSSVKGLGKKGAERIIVELKDKMKGVHEQLGKTVIPFTQMHQDDNKVKFNEACSALVVLGYSAIEANRAVSAVYNEDLTVEMVIKAALKQLL